MSLNAHCILPSTPYRLFNQGCTIDPNCYVYKIVDGKKVLDRVIPGIRPEEIATTFPTNPHAVKSKIRNISDSEMLDLWEKYHTVQGIVREIHVGHINVKKRLVALGLI